MRKKLREEQAREPFGTFCANRCFPGPKDHHALEWRLSNDRPSGVGPTRWFTCCPMSCPVSEAVFFAWRRLLETRQSVRCPAASEMLQEKKAEDLRREHMRLAKEEKKQRLAAVARAKSYVHKEMSIENGPQGSQQY